MKIPRTDIAREAADNPARYAEEVLVEPVMGTAQNVATLALAFAPHHADHPLH